MIELLFQTIGKVLIVLGLVLVFTGVLLYLGPQIPLWDKTPGNLRWQKGPVIIFFPLGPCVAASLLLSIVLYFMGRK